MSDREMRLLTRIYARLLWLSPLTDAQKSLEPQAALYHLDFN
jgi:hypothetical protein